MRGALVYFLSAADSVNSLLETTFNTLRLKGLLPHKLLVQNVRAFHVSSFLMKPTFRVYSTQDVLYTNESSEICLYGAILERGVFDMFKLMFHDYL